MEGRISKGKGSLIFGAPIYQGNTEGDAFDLFDSTTKERAEKPSCWATFIWNSVPHPASAVKTCLRLSAC
jgi:hypothetical protein